MYGGGEEGVGRAVVEREGVGWAVVEREAAGRAVVEREAAGGSFECTHVARYILDRLDRYI